MEQCDVPDKLTMLSYLSQIYDTFRGEIPHIKHPKLVRDWALFVFVCPFAKLCVAVFLSKCVLYPHVGRSRTERGPFPPIEDTTVTQSYSSTESLSFGSHHVTAPPYTFCTRS